MKKEIEYPHISVKLTGKDGNAFQILGSVAREMRRHNIPSNRIAEFTAEATSGDYNNLLATCMKWVRIE